jgi:hypothetical protein
VTDQVIDVYGAGAVEFSFPRTITETSGEDISADPVLVSLGSWTEPGGWVTPDRITRGTTDVGGITQHWVVVQLLIGGDLKPAADNYWLWTKITDSPETVPRRTSGRITIT